MYKIGQRVTIRPDLKANSCIKGVFVNSKMSECAGHAYYITNILSFRGRIFYSLSSLNWSWIEEMFCSTETFVFLKDYV